MIVLSAQRLARFCFTLSLGSVDTHQAQPTVRSRHRECPLCLSKFTSPRLLPCFHTFCLGCLKLLVPSEARTRPFRCPTCRTSITIPSGDLEKFQVNFYIEAEVEAAQSESGVRPCDMCDEGHATHKCSECDQFACDSCTKIHASISATRSHAVLAVGGPHATGRGKSFVTRERYCSTHNGEKIRFFCNQCDQVICRDCKLTSHEGHVTVDLSQKSTEARELVVKVTTMSRDILQPKLSQMLQEVEKQKEVVRKSKEDALKILTDRAEELKRKIDQYLKDAKLQLIQESDSVGDIVRRSVEDMTHEFASFLSLTEYAQCVARDGCDADALEMPAKLKEFFGFDVQRKAAAAEVHQSQLRTVASHQKRAAKLVSPSIQDSKLKSFTVDNWRVTVRVNSTTSLRQCQRCRNTFSEKYSFCPQCGSHAQRAAGSSKDVFVVSSFQTSHLMCATCGTRLNQGSGPCPRCERPEDRDTRALASIMEAVSEYIGQATRLQQAGDVSTPCGPTVSPKPDFSFAFGCGPTAAKKMKSEGSVTSTISDDIASIQSVLAEW